MVRCLKQCTHILPHVSFFPKNLMEERAVLIETSDWTLVCKVWNRVLFLKAGMLSVTPGYKYNTSYEQPMLAYNTFFVWLPFQESDF